MAEAYGLPLEVVDATLQLRTPGQWLVISHSALGLPVTPYLTVFNNAEKRVKSNLSNNPPTPEN